MFHILCFLLFQIVSSQYVKTIVRPSIVYRKDDLQIQCVQDSLREHDSIYIMSLSKINNGKEENVVQIEPDTNNPPTYCKIFWFNPWIEARATVTNSQLLPVNMAKLDLFITAHNVSCRDDGIYQCNIKISGGRSGSSKGEFVISVPDNSLNITDETPNKKTIYNVGDIIQLKCQASFSTPTCIRWCRRREIDNDFSEYNVYEEVKFTNITYDGCEYRRHSILTYNVSEEDKNTQFLCELSAGKPCQSTEDDHALFNIRNSNLDLVKINLPDSVIYKKQSIQIECSSKPLSGNQQIQSIALTRIHRNSAVLLIEATHSHSDGSTSTYWPHEDFKSRSLLLLAMIFPKVNATLRVEIPASNVECWDAAEYRCELFLTGNMYSLHQKQVNIVATGKYIEAVATTPVGLKKDKLSFMCATSYFDADDTVSQILLAKVTNNETIKLLVLELDLSSSDFSTKEQWYSEELRQRSKLITGTVFPAHMSKLHLEIESKDVQCKDAGTYMCEIFASNAKHGQSVTTVNITVESTQKFSVEELTCPKSNGQYDIGHKLILRCGGVVGNPPKVPQWCRKLKDEAQFSAYVDLQKTSRTSLMPDECQFISYSLLEYIVSEEDVNSLFVCVSDTKYCATATPDKAKVIRKASANAKEGSPNQICYRDVTTGSSVINSYIGRVIFLCLVMSLS